MKAIFSILVLGLVLCSGCAHQYVMKLNNGLQVTTASKPELRGGYYYYKDAEGKERSVAVTRVREIAPASMSNEEKARFKPTVQ